MTLHSNIGATKGTGELKRNSFSLFSCSYSKKRTNFVAVNCRCCSGTADTDRKRL
jgi:hypothetical protein